MFKITSALLNKAYLFIYLLTMYKYIIIISFFFLLLSCTGVSTKTMEEAGNICANIDSLSMAELNVNFLRYIPLETNEQSLISNITKVVFVDHCFYIFDRLAKRVVVFSDKGKYLYHIQKIGNGPGEYVEPIDMNVAQNGTIYIADNATQRIIEYTHEGKKFKDINVGFYFGGFALSGDGNFYLADIREKGMLTISLAKFEVETNKLTVIEAYEPALKRSIMYFNSHLFYHSYDRTYYYARFTPFVYALDGNNVSKQIELQTTKLPTKEQIAEWEKQKIGERFDAKGLICSLSGCYETKDFILLVSMSAYPIYTFIETKEHKVYNFQALGKRLNGNSGIRGVADSCFISFCIPSQRNISHILEVNENLKEEETKQFKELQEDDNPILMLFDFKIRLKE